WQSWLAGHLRILACLRAHLHRRAGVPAPRAIAGFDHYSCLLTLTGDAQRAAGRKCVSAASLAGSLSAADFCCSLGAGRDLVSMAAAWQPELGRRDRRRTRGRRIRSVTKDRAHTLGQRTCLGRLQAMLCRGISGIELQRFAEGRRRTLEIPSCQALI